jgi:SAM-dependent methyltransferase
MPDTHFGFREIPLDDKQALVDDVFHKVARRYDLMNDLMSAGLHRAWKDALVTAINPPRTERDFALLDVAGGTGDVSFRTIAAGGSGTRATVADINAEMLGVGRERACAQALDDVVTFVDANAEALPFPDRASMRYRSRSASATCRVSTSRWPRCSACCASAGVSCAWNSPTSTCRGSTRCTALFVQRRAGARPRWATPRLPLPGRSIRRPRPDAFAAMMRTVSAACRTGR